MHNVYYGIKARSRSPLMIEENDKRELHGPYYTRNNTPTLLYIFRRVISMGDGVRLKNPHRRTVL